MNTFIEINGVQKMPAFIPKIIFRFMKNGKKRAYYYIKEKIGKIYYQLQLL